MNDYIGSRESSTKQSSQRDLLPSIPLGILSVELDIKNIDKKKDSVISNWYTVGLITHH